VLASLPKDATKVRCTADAGILATRAARAKAGTIRESRDIVVLLGLVRMEQREKTAVFGYQPGSGWRSTWELCAFQVSPSISRGFGHTTHAGPM